MPFCQIISYCPYGFEVIKDICFQFIEFQASR